MTGIFWLRSLVPLVCGCCIGTGLSASVPTGALTSVMRPGMTIRGLTLPLDPLAGGNGRMLMAASAKVGDEPGVMAITSLRFTSGLNGKAFRLLAPRATFDTSSGTIRILDGFGADGNGFRMQGTGLSGGTKNLCFDLTGFVEIRLGSLLSPLATRCKQDGGERLSWIAETGEVPSAAPILQSANPYDMVRRFSGRIDFFAKCWSWVDGSAEAGGITLASRRGGRMDFGKRELLMAGSSAVLGTGLVLLSSEGIHLFHEEMDGSPLVRVTGEGGVEGWIQQGADHRETVVHSSSFAYVDDGAVLQFQGGPVVVRRNGVTLQATESWQFLRVFNGGRLVLSPGAWNMEGGTGYLSD